MNSLPKYPTGDSEYMTKRGCVSHGGVKSHSVSPAIELSGIEGGRRNAETVDSAHSAKDASKNIWAEIVKNGKIGGKKGRKGGCGSLWDKDSAGSCTVSGLYSTVPPNQG